MLEVWKKTNAPPTCLTQMLVLLGSMYMSEGKLLWFLQGDLKLSARKAPALQAKSGALPKPWRHDAAEDGAADCGPVEPKKAHFHIIALEKETFRPGVLRVVPQMFLHATRTREHGQRVSNVRSQVHLGSRKPSWSEGMKGLQNPCFPIWKFSFHGRPSPSPSLLIPPCNSRFRELRAGLAQKKVLLFFSGRNGLYLKPCPTFTFPSTNTPTALLLLFK